MALSSYGIIFVKGVKPLLERNSPKGVSGIKMNEINEEEICYCKHCNMYRKELIEELEQEISNNEAFKFLLGMPDSLLSNQIEGEYGDKEKLAYLLIIMNVPEKKVNPQCKTKHPYVAAKLANQVKFVKDNQ